jgi:hypothetical protein
MKAEKKVHKMFVAGPFLQEKFIIQKFQLLT